MLLSPPSRRRGLKLTLSSVVLCSFESPPSRRRGLKSIRFGAKCCRMLVASFSEAWIEISGHLIMAAF